MSSILNYHLFPPRLERLRTVYDTSARRLWFCVEDLCAILGYGMEEFRDSVDNSDVSTRQKMLVVSERGLNVFLHSEKTDKALRFKNWLQMNVSPLVQKEVELPNSLSSLAKKAIGHLREYVDLTVARDCLYEESMYFRDILQSPRLVQTQQVADDYGISKRELNKILRKLGLIYWQNGKCFLHSEYENCNLTDIGIKTVEGPDGTAAEVEEKGWTQHGRLFLYDFLSGIGVYPLLKKQRDMRNKNKKQ